MLGAKEELDTDFGSEIRAFESPAARHLKKGLSTNHSVEAFLCFLCQVAFGGHVLYLCSYRLRLKKL